MMIIVIIIIIVLSAANNHSFAFQRGTPWHKNHVIAAARFVERADVMKPHFQRLAQWPLESLHCPIIIEIIR